MKGRISACIIVLIINSLYIAHYFFRDGFISWMEYVGLPFMLSLAWWCGKQYDIAKFFSEKEPLTGLYNRRFLETYIAKIEATTKPPAQMFTLLLIDVNDFKTINDLYGHKTGDQYLKVIAHQLKKSAGEKDLVVRWGGDEFLILRQETAEKENLGDTIERIHKNLKNASPKDIEISVSIGRAHYPLESRKFDDLLKIADKNMYSIKSQKPNTKLANWYSHT